MTTVARHAYASLALSAKLHKLLDQVAKRQASTHAAAFAEGVASATDAFNEIPETLRAEARTNELSLLKRDFDELERLYGRMKPSFAETATQRFDRIFTEIKEKIREKELTH